MQAKQTFRQPQRGRSTPRLNQLPERLLCLPPCPVGDAFLQRCPSRLGCLCDPSGARSDPSGARSDPSGAGSDPSGARSDPSEARSDIQFRVALEASWLLLVNNNHVPVRRTWTGKDITVSKLENKDVEKEDTSGIYCICLADRPDRFARACEEAHRWGLCRILVFLRPRRPTDSEMRAANATRRGFFGSWESHRLLARLAMERGLTRLLVFEDDFSLLPSHTSPTRLKRIATDLARLDGRGAGGWEQFFLGHMPFGGWPTDTSGRVFRTRSCWIHAYLLSVQGQHRLAAWSYELAARVAGAEKTLDGWMGSTMSAYAAFPMIAVQAEAGGSDNVPTTDRYGRLVEWWTGVHRVHSHAIEIVAYSASPVLVILLALLLALVVAALLRGIGRVEFTGRQRAGGEVSALDIDRRR